MKFTSTLKALRGRGATVTDGAMAWARRLDAEGVKLRWNTRYKTTAGEAKWGQQGQRSIELNPRLKLEGPEAFAGTLLHEMAHIAAGRGHGHDSVWQLVLMSFGRKPARCHGYATMQQRERRVVAECDACAFKLEQRKRLPRSGVFKHRGCGGVFRKVE